MGFWPPPEWYKNAVCASIDPALWFPEKGEDAKKAKKICREKCPVQEACLYEALRNDEYGVWGGTSRQERNRMMIVLADKDARKTSPIME